MLQAPVPAGTQFVSATQGGTEDDGVVSWSLGTVGVGSSGERRFTVQVTDTVAEALFCAAELSDAVDPNEVRVRAEAAAPVQAAPPLTLDMTLTPDPVQPSELLRVDLTVRNPSQITVTAATLQNQTLDGTTIVSTDGGSCTPDARCLAGYAVNWSLGTLSPGQSVQRQLILRAGATLPAGTLLFNTATRDRNQCAGGACGSVGGGRSGAGAAGGDRRGERASGAGRVADLRRELCQYREHGRCGRRAAGAGAGRDAVRVGDAGRHRAGRRGELELGYGGGGRRAASAASRCR